MASFTFLLDEPDLVLPQFRASISGRLLQRVEAMPEAAFWGALASVGCDSGAVTDRAARLAQQLAPAALLAAGRRMGSLRVAFIERLSAWEQSTGSRVPLADIGMRRDLATHVTLLGEEEYAAVLGDPSRALHLVAAGDFLAEGRSLFEQALAQYPLEVLEGALRGALPPVRYEPSVALSDGQVIDHPEHGLGVVSSILHSNFADVRFRTGTYSFSGPREESFRQAVQFVLSGWRDDEPEESQWQVLASLGWGRERPDRGTIREQILARLSLADCCAMRYWLAALERKLISALTKWD
jgi:hypothetical protein